MSTLNISDFSGGLNNSQDQTLIADNESPDLQNVWVDDVGKSGILTKRRGIATIVTASASGVTFGTGGVTTFGKIYSFTNVPTAASTSSTLAYYCPVTGTSGGFVFFSTADSYLTFVDANLSGSTGGDLVTSSLLSYNDNIYALQSGTSLDKITQSTTGASFSAVTGLLGTPYAMTMHKDMMFLATTSPSVNVASRLFWSNTGNPTVYPSTNFVDIGTGDGASITALVSYRDTLLVFKANRFPIANNTPTINTSGGFYNGSLWRVDGDVSGFQNGVYSVKKISSPPNIGIIYPDSIIEWNNNLFFLTNDGIYFYDGNEIQKFSNKIQKTADGLFQWRYTGDFGKIVSSDKTLVAVNGSSVVYKNNLWIFCNTLNLNGGLGLGSGNAMAAGGSPFTQTDLSNNTILFSNGQSIWKWLLTTLRIPNAVLDYQNQLISGLINGDSNAVMTFKLDQESRIDHNQAIRAYYTTKEFILPEQQYIKFCNIIFRGQPNGLLTVEVNIDQHGWVPATINMRSAYKDIRKSERINIGQKGRSIQFRLSNNEPYVNFEIFSISAEYSPLGESNVS